MDHVEECPSYYVDCLGTICDCDYEHICMCRELRACEERIKTHEGCADAERIEGYLDGYAAALDAAREAVARQQRHFHGWDYSCIDPENALAAIDALRKDQP